ARRRRSRREGTGAGQRIVLLLAAAPRRAGCARVGRRAIRGPRPRVDGPRVGNERVERGRRRLGLVRAAAGGWPRPDVVSLARSGRRHEPVQRRLADRRERRAHGARRGRRAARTARLLAERGDGRQVSGALAAHDPPRRARARRRAGARRPGARALGAVLGRRGPRDRPRRRTGSPRQRLSRARRLLKRAHRAGGPSKKIPDRYVRPGIFALRSLAMSYSRVESFHTTIGAERFHFRVRDGIGWFPFAIAARQTGLALARTSIELARAAPQLE